MGLDGKNVLVLVGGGIAAYKVAELVRRLRDEGAGVRCAMSAAAQQFITPLTLATLSGKPVATDLFTAETSGAGHIQLARDCDAVLVAPATADLIAKRANGHADDLLSAILLAADRPVLIAPAMNPSMWANPAVVRNCTVLRTDGIHFAGPESGMMAERAESGFGRMSEPAQLVAALAQILSPAKGPLAGRRILVTSGPTREPIDPIRFISNRSSGQQGHAIAGALVELGAEVHLVSGPVTIPDPRGAIMHRVESAEDMAAAVEALLPVDAGVFAAAVGDWRVAEVAGQKLKKQSRPPTLELIENQDILATVGHHRLRPRLVVGFAAETSQLLENARGKLTRKGADLIVGNDVSAYAMGGIKNRVTIVSPDGANSWPELDKTEVAHRLAQLISARLTD